MAREMYADSQVPATGAAGIPYKDNKELVNGVLKHVPELFVAQGTGAGGAGFAITNVPFEPAALVSLNQAGANPAICHSIYSPTAAHTITILAVAANANPAVITQVGDNDWTVTLTTQMAPDGEVVTVLLFGSRDVSGSL